jgi:predicted transcriptional regulator
LSATPTITVRIPEEIWLRYQHIAERENRSTGNALRTGLKRDLAEQENGRLVEWLDCRLRDGDGSTRFADPTESQAA